MPLNKETKPNKLTYIVWRFQINYFFVILPGLE